VESNWKVSRIFDIPAPRKYRLERLPLVLAVVQLNYPIVGRLQTLEGVTPIQEALKDVFPYMNRIQVDQLAVLVGPNAPTVGEPQRTVGWRFTDDSGWVLNLNPSSAHIAVGKEYSSVGDMEERLVAVINALVEAGEIKRAERLGVRFVNFAEIQDGEQLSWRSWFRSEIVGWTGMDFFAEGSILQSNIQQSVLVGPNGRGPRVQSLVRNGLIPAGSVMPTPDGSQEPLKTNAFVLDIDVFLETPQPMTKGALIEQFRSMHGDIDAFFRECLTPAGETHFGLVEL
jgi:uncharacterized protein (TIGR04255 family)